MTTDRYNQYISFATERQQEYIRAVQKHGSQRAAARALDVAESSLRSSLKLLEKKAAKRASHTYEEVPAGYMLKGTSTLYDEAGSKRMQWVKTTVDHEVMEALKTAFWETFSSDLPKVKKSLKKVSKSDIMSVYPISDTHLGMLAWHGEVDEDADLYRIEELTYSALSGLVDTVSHDGHAVLEILGDFFHFDAITPVTSKSGHVLDSDSRYAKVFEVAVNLLKRMISCLLEKHKSVHVVVASGNHDEMSARHLAICLHHVYENDQRVSVDRSHSMFHYVTWGDVGICVHHGDKTRMKSIRETFSATDIWCNTKHRYVHTGHVHSDNAADTPGCLVESFRVIIPSDSYAHSHGYGGTARDLKRIDYHKKFGRVSTAYITPQMIDFAYTQKNKRK